MKNQLLKIVLFTCFIIIGLNLLAQVPKDDARPRILQIDQTELHAQLGFEPKKGMIKGTVYLDFKVIENELDSLWLDGIRMNINTLLLDKDIVNYKTFPKGIAVFPDRPLSKNGTHQLEIGYAAAPKRGMYFLGWNDPSGNSRKQIWTQGQGIDNRHWLPHVDAQNDKLLCKLSILFDSTYQVVSNGKLVAKNLLNSQMSWQYEMMEPMSSYLMMIAIGEFDSYMDQSLNGTTITNYFYPEWAYRNKWTYYKNSEIFNYLVKEIGTPYPWHNYKQVPVKDFQHGAMENTSATIFGDFYCVDSISFNDDNYVGVNAHELAHQWFGNSVTAISSHDHWLHEGFATYYSWMAEKEVFGNNRFNEIRLKAMENVLLEAQSNEYPLHHSKAGSVRFYEQGAWFLHMLRTEIGDSAYEVAIDNYLWDHAYDLVATDDFRRACENASNQELGQFFEQWLERPDLPKVRFTASYDEKDLKLSMTFKQEQKITSRTPPFLLNIPLIIHTNQDVYTYDVKFGNEIKNINLYFTKGERIGFIEIDPALNNLVEWTYDFPGDWKANAMLFSEYNTYKSSLFMEDAKRSPSDQELGIYLSEDYPEYLKVYMVNALLRKSSIPEKDLAEIASKGGFDVKKAYLNKQQILPDHEKMVRSWLTLPSYELQEKALIKLFISFPENTPEYLELTKNSTGTRGNNVKVIWELIDIIYQKGDKGPESLIVMTGEEYDFLTRMSALDAIQQLRLPDLSKALIDNCLQGLFQGNRRWRGMARTFLINSYKDEQKQKSILAFIELHKGEWEDWQITRVEKTFSIEIKQD